MIELLVVISIIALLIGILLPVIGKARKASFATKCQSNLHQIGVAMFAYATDHDDFFPDPATTGGHGYRIEPDTELGPQYGPTFVGIGGAEQLGLAAVLDDQGYMDAKSGGWLCPAARPEYQENGNTYSFNVDNSLSTTRTFAFGLGNGDQTPLVWDSFNLEIGFPNQPSLSIPGTNLGAVPPDYFVHGDNKDSVLKSVQSVYGDGHVQTRDN